MILSCRLLKRMAMVFLAAGIWALAVPGLGKICYRFKVQVSFENFNTLRKEEQPAGMRDELYHFMQDYNKRLFEDAQSNLTDPFSYQQPDFQLSDFGYVEEAIGYLIIDKMEITLPVFLGANDENLKKGAAHLTQTSLPVGGSNTNAVIAAHRGMGTKEMFLHIDKLEPGDMIKLQNFRETLNYEVDSVMVIAPTDINRVLIVPGEDMLTLITCHPRGRNDQRYVVYCRRIK